MGDVQRHRGECTSMGVHTRAWGAHRNMGGRRWHRGHALAWGECTTTGVHAPAQGADCFQTATGAPPAPSFSKAHAAPPPLLSPRRNRHVFCRKDLQSCPVPGPPTPRIRQSAPPLQHSPAPAGFLQGSLYLRFLHWPPPSQPHQPSAPEPNLLHASPPGAALPSCKPKGSRVWAVLPEQGGRSRFLHVRGSPLLHCAAPMQASKSPLL